MSIEKRAAQFAPFAALTGYDEAIEESGRYTDMSIELESDAVATLDRKIAQLQAMLTPCGDGQNLPTVTVTYFKADRRKSGGQYETLQGEVKQIDVTKREIVMKSGTRIGVPQIVDLGL